MSTEDVNADEIEPVEDFRLRARSWIRDNLVEVGPLTISLRTRSDEEELAGVARDREIQRMFFDNGFAGICFPKEYGGQGLTPAHQRAFNDELAGYEYPVHFQAPTMTPCAAVINEFGTHEQKQRHLTAILRGEEIWMQFLSEPSGGSDLAGALMRADRDGDEWVLNGSKVWTTGAWWSDWGLCLARTNWDVPKHRGLTIFMLPIRQDGVEVHRIEMLNGNKEFCQEFLSDVRVPDSDRIGEVDEGWTVGTRWLFHERMLYNSPYVTFPANTVRGGDGAAPPLEIAKATGHDGDPATRELVGESLALELVASSLKDRVTLGVVSGKASDQSAAVARLFHGMIGERRVTIAFELAGSAGAAWEEDGGDGALADAGSGFLMRQVGSIGGGTTEMARNVVSERVLGMPREKTADHGIPFRDVPRSAS